MKTGRLTAAIWSKLVLIVVCVAGATLAMFWLAGAFVRKTPPGVVKVPQRAVGGAVLATVEAVWMPRTEAAVGTIEAVHEIALGSKLLAPVKAVHVQAGAEVKTGDVLVELDDRDLRARLDQASAAIEAAKAARDQAKVDYDRIVPLHEKGAASETELNRYTNALRAAEAKLQEAEQARSEAQTMLSYATIRSPIDGVVIDKQVEAGDTVTPGQVLVRLYDPSRMQLVANVRESLAERIQVGQPIDVQIEALNQTCEGQISEIVPQAAADSRAFQVKVTGPCHPGVISGMFGRMLIPLDPEAVVLIPRQAVRRVGQLDLVDVAEDGVLKRRAVQLGRRFGDRVEVLSGLQAGEQVALSGS
jgi:membrane fusion protein (multidrug efflux system)